MISVKFFSASIAAAYRSFSTKTSKKHKYAYEHRTMEKKESNEHNIKWTEEQKDVLNFVRCGLSVFITGSAGTGKTVLLKRIINILQNKHGTSAVFVTASTGTAACALKGQTIHSFAGFGFGDDDTQTLLKRILMNSHARKRWKNAESLIIDEISMIDANMFDNLEYFAREIRGSSKVWGGIQLIVSGDFHQLPPVLNKCVRLEKLFTFESDCWNASFDKQVQLEKIFRQSDAEFVNLLQHIRKGEKIAKDMQLLEQCSSCDVPDSSVRIYPRIEDVNRVNEEKMRRLNEKVVVYLAADGGEHHRRAELKHVLAPYQLDVCIGARVMLIKNLNVRRKLCNGATGTVTRFVKPKNEYPMDLSPDNLLPVVKFDSGKEMIIEPRIWEILEGGLPVAWRFQIPLRLAWALSIHKCQGMTLDSLHVDLYKSFGYGMVYVALSRVKTLKGLHLSGFRPSMIKAHPKVLRFYESLAGDFLT